MGKLVRDYIPDEDTTREYRRYSSERDFRISLLDKLEEEVAEARDTIFNPEYVRSGEPVHVCVQRRVALLEELADVAEVVETLCMEYGFSLSELRDAQASKRHRRGGYSRRMHST
jgi:predicted house-cleaning noncanonical NTP pyrophosphatase (MazG superfamily)